MKLSFTLYRTTTTPAHDFAEMCDASGKSVPELEAIFRKKFYPFAPGFKVFWPDAMPPKPLPEEAEYHISKIVFGIEAMDFDLTCEKVPFAGLIECDPVKSVDVERLDGALWSEIARIGIHTEIDSYKWRVAYELKGN